MAHVNRDPPMIEADRYRRIRELGWDPLVLRRAHFLVVGAGALGNEVLKNLALLGVGQVTVVDMDAIESHNLTRSVLFRVQDVGCSKAETAARRMSELNPDVRSTALVGPVQDMFGLGAYRCFNAVLGCLDNGQARYDVGRACWQTGTLFIDAGLDHLNGDVRVYQSPHTACYACSLNDEARQTLGNRHQCLQLRIGNDQPTIPTAPTISSLAAGWQTQIAIKHLHGMPLPLGKRLGVYGLLDEPFVYTLSINLDCEANGEHALLDVDRLVEADLSVQTCTPRELLDFALQIDPALTNRAVVDLGYDFIKSAECSLCGRKTDIMQRKDHVFIDQVTCCGEIMFLEDTYQIRRGDRLADLSLAELGVPPLEILTVKNTFSADHALWKFRFIEMHNDVSALFGSPELARHTSGEAC